VFFFTLCVEGDTVLGLVAYFYFI